MVWNDASQNNLLTELLPPPKRRLTNTEKLLSSLYMEISSKIPLATERVQLWQSHCTLNCLFLKFPAPQGKWSPERQSQIMADVKVNGFGRDYSLSIRINQRHSLKGKERIQPAAYGKASCIFKAVLHHSLHCPGPASSSLHVWLWNSHNSCCISVFAWAHDSKLNEESSAIIPLASQLRML